MEGRIVQGVESEAKEKAGLSVDLFAAAISAAAAHAVAPEPEASLADAGKKVDVA